VKLTTPPRHIVRNFIAMDDLLRSRPPHDNCDIHPWRKVLEKSTQWSDADPSTDQDDPVRCSGMMRECSVRPFDTNSRAWFEVGNGAALIAKPLDGYPDVRRPGSAESE
jgi:hypothetical protein